MTNQLGPYLAGLIEGDGTFAIHDKESTAKKYAPMIIIVFKKSDLPFAKFLRDLINCGKVYEKPDRGYILWQIQDLISVYIIINLINGYMRTPKIEALGRTIFWINNYIDDNKNSKLPSTQRIVSKISKLETCSLDTSRIDSNSWLAGFSDADANFSINIYKRSNKISTRVQLYYRLEIRQNYHRLSNKTIYSEPSYFPIMSEIGKYLDVNIYSRIREINNKNYSSFTVISHNRSSNLKIIDYFERYPLLSSKYLDYISFKELVRLQNDNSVTSTYLEIVVKTRKDFNKTRTSYN
jgi:LAGLIDADG endonuclease